MVDIISLKEIKKTYAVNGGFAALDNISLSIEKEEFVVIIGRSGSGKSTLLHIMGCLDSPTEGEVYICGTKTNTLSNDEIAEIRRKKIGFVFQAFNLIPNLDVLGNVAIPLMFDGVPKSEREERAKKMLESVGLAERLYYYPNKLSGGEKQRVAIARALINNPEIIIADEPTGNLDSISANNVLEIFAELHKKQKKTIIIVTHEEYVVKFAERVFCIKDGKLTDYKYEGKKK